MGKRIRRILLDLLKSFRWYLLFIPFILLLYLIGKLSPALAAGLSMVPLFFIFFLGIPILITGAIVCYLLSNDEKYNKKNKKH